MTQPAITPQLTADAKNRAARTFVQTLLVAIGVAVIPIVQKAIASGVDKVDWSTLGWASLTAALTALLSFVWRRFIDPSSVSSMEPPPEPPAA